MNDTFYEQLVVRKAPAWTMLVRILIVLAVALLIFPGMLFIGGFAFILSVGLAFLAYYLIFPKLNVEYEYDVANYDMGISAIYSKASRKDKMNFDIREVDMIAPKGSPRLHNAGSLKTYDFSSGEADRKVYAVVTSIGSQKVCIYLEPNDKILQTLKDWAGSKMYMD